MITARFIDSTTKAVLWTQRLGIAELPRQQDRVTLAGISGIWEVWDIERNMAFLGLTSWGSEAEVMGAIVWVRKLERDVRSWDGD